MRENVGSGDSPEASGVQSTSRTSRPGGARWRPGPLRTSSPGNSARSVFSSVRGRVAVTKTKRASKSRRGASAAPPSARASPSTSSSTTSVAARRETVPSPSNRSSRPGVMTSTSHAPLNVAASRAAARAAVATRTRHRSPPSLSSRATPPICAASSAVGATTTARGAQAPRGLGAGEGRSGDRPSAARRRLTSGRRYASVFPEPVWSATSASRPPAIAPYASAWQRVGAGKPRRATARTASGGAPRSSQLLRDANAWSVGAAFGAARRCVRLHSSGAAGRTSHTHIVTRHISGTMSS